MNEVFIIAEHKNNRLLKQSIEIIQHVAAKVNNVTNVILLGEELSSLSKEPGFYGADRIYLIQSTFLKSYTFEVYTHSVLELLKKI